MISQTSEYAIRAVVYLASMDGGPATTQEISQATLISQGYLAKILRTLSHSGVLTARRGIGGGFTLARPPSQINILEVLRSANDETIKRVVRCPLGNPAHSSLCAVHKLFDDALAQIEQLFVTTTIADMLKCDSQTQRQSDQTGCLFHPKPLNKKPEDQG